MTDFKSPEAVIYCRVARSGHATPGYSIKSQEERCRKIAQDVGYEVIAVFSDHASGRSTDRPGLEAFLVLVRTHSGIAVIVDDLTRLACDVKVYVKIRDIFSDAGAKLITPKCAFNNDPECKRFERSIISAAQRRNDEEDV